MPFPYLGGHRWLDLTRDERFFCAELYIALKQPDRLAAFIDRLNAALQEKDPQLVLDKDASWEVGYEVAFYRDYIHALGAPVDGKLVHEIGSTRYSRKRTFDLCLFGNDRLVIIEAKVRSVTTHDAITYSQKAAAHRSVHPYLRYGIALGIMGATPLPGRLYRHGQHLDFMYAFRGAQPTPKEWTRFLKLIRDEVAASRHMEALLYQVRGKDRQRHVLLHRKLVLE